MLVLAGCAPVTTTQDPVPVKQAAREAAPMKPLVVDSRVAAELDRAASQPPRAPDASQIQDALLPPLRADMPGLVVRAREPRFDIAINNAPASQVFLSIVSGTRYSLLLHPEVAGNVTLTLKDTTVREALDALRDLYGYEYRIEGARIFVQPAAIQTRLFRVNYMVAQRLGRSDIRVPAGSGGESPGVRAMGASGPDGMKDLSSAAGDDASRIQTTVRTDFWEALRSTLLQIIGTQAGRSVVVNPQASLVVVRAMPSELREVDHYLREIRLSVERQVMLEAKIVEVTLNERFQSGVNWSLYGGAGNTAQASGSVSGGTLIAGVPGGSLFGLALQTQNFNSLLSFLESQGSVQVLSSPRIATMNNQKAVLKVGTDAFFVTNVAGGTSATGVQAGGTTTFPALTLRPFFSGVALDVMPQIDDESVIILHVHPSVSNVQQDDKTLNLGTAFGGISLPVARSSVSETDSIVRVRHGDIVAIGGLMKLDLADERHRMTGAREEKDTGNPLPDERKLVVKKELVILIKPTVIQSEREWVEDLRDTRDRMLELAPAGATR